MKMKSKNWKVERCKFFCNICLITIWMTGTKSFGINEITESKWGKISFNCWNEFKILKNLRNLRMVWFSNWTTGRRRGWGAPKATTFLRSSWFRRLGRTPSEFTNNSKRRGTKFWWTGWLSTWSLIYSRKAISRSAGWSWGRTGRRALRGSLGAT